MVLNFTLNPHTKNIIVGRKGSSIVCAVCKDEIIVTGEVKCPRCKNTTVKYPENIDMTVSFKERDKFLTCPVCHISISIKDENGNYVVMWTQKVVSKHRKKKHTYYHEEHWNNKFYDVKDE